MKSIGTKFSIAVAGLAAVFAVFVLYRTWSVTDAHVTKQVALQTELALEFNLAIRKYVAEKIRPRMEALVEKNEFIPETMSTSYVARSIFEEVRKKFPDYIIKFSAENPRNPINQAGPDEMKMIEYFNKNPEVKRWAGEIRLRDKQYFAQFKARRMKKSCLRCHGRPEDAPASMRRRYGDSAGFYRRVGDVVALDTIAIPTDKVRTVLAAEAFKQSIVMVVALGVLFGAIILMFRLLISRRLAVITSHFKQAAERPDTENITPVKLRGRDEVGVLAAAFNTLAAKLHDSYASLECRVSQRTSDLAKANDKLQIEITERKRADEERHKSMKQLERFNRLAVGREQRMIELKGEVNDILRSTGQQERYKTHTSEGPEPIGAGEKEESHT